MDNYLPIIRPKGIVFEIISETVFLRGGWQELIQKRRVQGPMGPMGPMGPLGPTGPMGTMAPLGPMGTMGLMGPAPWALWAMGSMAIFGPHPMGPGAIQN